MSIWMPISGTALLLVLLYDAASTTLVTAAICTISGLALTTMAITFLVPVVSAVTARRTQAATIAGLGPTCHDIILRAWRGNDLGILEQLLPPLAHGILLTGQRQLSYPVVRFFHSSKRDTDFRVQLFELDEAVTLLQHGLAAGSGPHPAVLRSVRRAVDTVIERVDDTAISDAPPAPPDLGPLRNAGLTTVDDATFHRRVAAESRRRRRLNTFAAESLWHERRSP